MTFIPIFKLLFTSLSLPSRLLQSALTVLSCSEGCNNAVCEAKEKTYHSCPPPASTNVPHRLRTNQVYTNGIESVVGVGRGVWSSRGRGGGV